MPKGAPGKPKSEEHRRKIGLAHKGKKKGPSPFRLSNVEVKRRIRKHWGNTYDLSKINYVGSGKKIEIVCKTHGSFWKIPADIMYGKKSGCPKCAGHGLTIEDYRERWTEKARGKPWSFKSTPHPAEAEDGTKLPATCKLHGHFLFGAISLGLSGIGGCRECNYTELIANRFAKGRCARDPNGKDYLAYRQRVRRYSAQNFKRHFPGKERTRETHLDHVYSILDGWLNNVSPEIVGHYTNLRLMKGHLNQSKSSKSEKSLKQLLADYRKAKSNE
jgi:hypothetical protein